MVVAGGSRHARLLVNLYWKEDKQGSWLVFILFFFPGYLLFPFSKPFSVFKTN
jgi:hypothetical protein